MRRQIEKWPSRVLSQPSVPVTDFADGALQSLINDMLEMVQADGCPGWGCASGFCGVGQGDG